MQIINHVETSESMTKLAQEYGIGIAVVSIMKRDAAKMKTFYAEISRMTAMY